jgi:hypothetical protein
VPECTVIGYSFRDPWIRRIFEDATIDRKPSDFRIRVVCRSARTITKSWPRLEKFIDPVPERIQQYLELPAE